ncbi:MAG: hypothetical protein L6455_07920, partial [Kiritimatiellae bacterium]|nr:hypothetical protein [Kiritimatiellia bacterium]
MMRIGERIKNLENKYGLQSATNRPANICFQFFRRAASPHPLAWPEEAIGSALELTINAPTAPAFGRYAPSKYVLATARAQRSRRPRNAPA